MPVPKTIEECQARAKAYAIERVEKWKLRDQTKPHVNDFAEEEFQDAYASEFDELRALMDVDGRCCAGIPSLAKSLVDLCVRMRSETDAPSALGIAVGAIIAAAEADYQHPPDVALMEIVAGLVDIFGGDRVRAAIGQG
jgi:hypothetical protein